MNMPLWFSNLVFWSAQVALLVLAAALLPRLLRLRQPRVLLAYWRALLGVNLLLPFIQPWHRPLNTAAIVISMEFERLPVPPSSPAPTRWHLPDLQATAQVLGAVILAGIVVRFVILALGLLKLRHLRRASSPFSPSAESTAALEEMRARVNANADFRLSADVDSPVTFGFSSPLILLPEGFPSLQPRFQAAIACHELLHVRRHDWAHHLCEEVIRAALWFHPAIAWLISRVRLAREQVVDLEVVNLTQARKPYLEALLEFTNSRSSITAIPAPPFLAERQLVERVSLMLKEVRMSRRRLIASLTVISCCLPLVIALAAWTFPLKAAPRPAQNPPQGGIAKGISGAVTSGVTGGIEGGINSELAKRQHVDEPNVDYSTIWTDTVKRGPMVRQVRALGTLVHADSGSLIGRITLPEIMVKEVQPNQNAALATKKGPLVKGHVSSISREVVNGTVAVDIALDAVPQEAAAGLEVDATIDIGKLDNVLYVGRPVHITANAAGSLFKIANAGKEAERVIVKFGRASVNTIEVLEGLKEGDKVILSDMSEWDKADRIHLTDNMHLLHH